MNGVNFGLVETAVAKHGCLQKKCGQFDLHPKSWTQQTNN